MATYVLHHRDADGYCAAVAAWKYLTTKEPVVEYISVQYNEPVPDVNWTKEDTVYILDFSYERDVLEDLRVKVKEIVVLDHHKTAQKELEGLDYAVFDLSISGAELAWNWFAQRDSSFEPMPDMFKYVGDRDMWKFEYPQTKPYSLGILTEGQSHNLDYWIRLYQQGGRVQELVDIGNAVQQYIDGHVNSMVNGEKYTLITFGGYVAALYNTTTNISEIAEAMYTRLNIEMTMSYFISSTGEVIFSLRSKKDSNCDVSCIARDYGGGGHRNAAGFSMKPELGMEFLADLYTNDGISE